jgi:hypothetical protein
MSQADAASTTKYRLDINVTWSAETHPYDFFLNAHLTRLLGATHNSRYILFGDGRTASSGLQSIAERGHVEILKAEMADANERERLDQTFEAEAFGVPGRISLTFEATEEYGHVSFATMIAPSPDWFTGAASVQLFSDGNWIEGAEVVLWPWDAGTDTGTTWTAENIETQPRESIRLLTAPYFFDASGIRPLGTATFTRIE